VGIFGGILAGVF